MDPLLQSLTQHTASVVFALMLCIILLAAATLNLMVKNRAYEAKWKTLLADTRGESLETLLYDHLKGRMELVTKQEKTEERVSRLEAQMVSAKRFVGLVRYDAFPDVSGNQSFALAVYDDRGDGAIVSSIVGRSTCRVYCKPLAGGRSERDLSQEEQRAIREAVDGGTKAILSP